MLQYLPLPIFSAVILGIHPQPFHLEGIGIVLTGGEDGGMAVVGHGDVDDDDYILPPGTNENVLDHYVIILVIPAEYQLRHPFQTDMVRVDFPDTAVRQRPGTDPLESHIQLAFLPRDG
jgi:hypothetical protein